jgi:NADH-quinone oxidoreductase subunit M
MTSLPWLTLLTLLPLFGAMVLAGMERERRELARQIGLAISLVVLGVVGLIVADFRSDQGGFQLVERHAWMPSLGVEYHLGLDGLSLVMLLLTALVVPMALLVSSKVEKQVPLYFALVLFLEAGLIGTFTALNFIHWFLFWELCLIPAFFLIKLWGGPGRSAAALQFFVYTMVGSIALLLAFLALYAATGTFEFDRLAALARSGELLPALSARLGWHNLSRETIGLAVFLLALLGFAVKVPLMPFHTWLPQTYTEAPSPVTMLLTGLMSKMGVYGLLRIILPIFPEQLRAVQTPLLWLAVATIVFASAAALVQKDLKRVLAYSSINHLGYCLLGVFAAVSYTGTDAKQAVEAAAVLNGVVVQMFSHGLSAGTLFAFIAFLEQRSGGRRGLEDFGGLRRVAPVFCGLMGIALFSSLGLPGLNGFVGEFLIFKGAFALTAWATVLSVPGLLLTALFLLTLLQRVFNGPLNERWQGFADLTPAERVTILPAITLMFLLGICPQFLVGLFNETVLLWVERLAQ